MTWESAVGVALALAVIGFIGQWKAKTGADKERFRARVSWPFWLVGIGRPTEQEREWARVGRKRAIFPLPSLSINLASPLLLSARPAVLPVSKSPRVDAGFAIKP